ncbi:ABC transporter substrate-binding protein [Winogradskyella eckloniae]|uniref:type IX secretion system anionic LPS delivery protein PorZ n=1 Tax=Winogradskyella eckloniae TaxID=1089306 RepID=UPI001566F2E2|nr:two-component regulator propeller domain-containing protein [Winogradskyella eckloniae]NRD19031.1 ABC transporter substrate-binding protein [Winogradskyella eckloniae]
MRKIIFNVFVLLFSFSTACYSQDFEALWQGHFSYNSIIDVVSGEDKIFAAGENAVFEYNTLTNEINTITTVDGLSGESITTIYYSEAYQYLIIGYETGLIELYTENDDDAVLTIVDILEKQNITPANKRINHFYEHNGLIYISTDYGVSIYDLQGLEFGDTYFLGNGGAQITVNQVAIANDEIFVACLDENGIKKAALSNPNLIDFQQWETVITGNYYYISTLDNSVYSVRSNGAVYEIDGTIVNTLFTLPTLPVDTDVAASHLMFSMPNSSVVYDINLQLVNTFQPNAVFNTSFTATTIVDDEVFIGTEDFGVLKTGLHTASIYTEIKPNGPLYNNVFRINSDAQAVWVTFGDYSASINPFPLRSRGLSYLRNEAWVSIPYDSLFQAKNLSEISVNPFNTSQVFISAVHTGLIELNNFEPTDLYDHTNSGLESLFAPTDPTAISVRITDTQFDRDGLLWTVSSRIDSPLKSYNPSTGNWQSYSFTSLIEDGFDDEDGFFEVEIDNNGTKWIGSYDNGLIAFNESVSNNPLRNINTAAQNVQPFTRFISLAIDNNNQLWVGTTNGLRVLYNTSGFYDDPNPTLSQVIILEDGIAKELLESQIITDIEVDGSNNKWISTVDSGVFYFTPDGQTTVYHFTKDNSPLPSNTVNDVSIDENNGIVYIATDKGLLGFKAGGTKVQETLEDAYVYPNPVRPEYNILGLNDLTDINKGIKVSGLTDSVNIKITDIEGNLVAEAQSNINLRSSNNSYNFAIDGGTAIWNGKNMANSVVRTGVYLILISDLESFETKVLKVLIVR